MHTLGLPVAARAPAERRVLRTWHLFALASLLAVALAWANNEFVMTREVYHNLLGSQMDADRIDQQFDFMRQMSKWGYLAAPLIIWLRVALVALVIQMLGLLFLVEIPFQKLFRAALFSFFPLLYGTALKALGLYLEGPRTVDADALSVVPLSLASALYDPGEVNLLAYSAMSMVNVWEVFWALALGFALMKVAGVTRGVAAGLVTASWVLITLLQLAISASLMGLG